MPEALTITDVEQALLHAIRDNATAARDECDSQDAERFAAAAHRLAQAHSLLANP